MSIDNHLLDQPLLLMALRTWVKKDKVPEDIFMKVVATHSKRYNILKSHGYNIQILGVEKCTLPDEIDEEKVWRYMQFFEEEKPGSVLKVKVENDIEFRSLLWPDDIFQVYGTIVYAAPGLENLTSNIIEKLGIQTDIISSKLGDGGYVIRDDNILTISEATKDQSAVKRLQETGYKVFFLPTMKRNKALSHSEYTLADRMELLEGHIDCEINQRNANIAVTPEYYNAYENRIKDYCAAIAKSGNSTPDLFVIPNEEVGWKAPNFRTMPDQKIIMLDKCPKTAEWYKSKVGDSNVILLPYDNIDFYYSGGFKCRSNLVI